MFQGIEDSPIREKIKESHQEYDGIFSKNIDPSQNTTVLMHV